MFLGRYLNCFKLHINGVRFSDENKQKGTRGALIEMWTGYMSVFLAGMETVRKPEHSFVIEDEVLTAKIGHFDFEISGDFEKLPFDERLAWHFLKDSLVIYNIQFGNLTLKPALEKYPEVFKTKYSRKRFSEYTFGPEGTLGRKSNEERTGAGAVEHLGGNRDIPNLAVPRRINGFGTVEPPPETNSSISTVGRIDPTFSLEGRTYMFCFAGANWHSKSQTRAMKVNRERKLRHLLVRTRLNSSWDQEKSIE